MTHIKWITPIVALFIIAVFIFYKPSRILIPEVNDVDCVTKILCLDDISRLHEADELVAGSIAAVENRLGSLNNHPKFVFCSTQRCFEQFGFKRAAAQTVGRSGIVIGPNGWKPHYVKHEIIHHWQAENIGVIKMHFVDDWLIEGMAYTLSDDPRKQLTQPWQAYREAFMQWYSRVDRVNLVTAINSI